MKLTKLLTRCVAMLMLLVTAQSPLLAYNVYFDNSKTKWAQPKVHYWGGSESSTWSGKEMSPYQDNPNLQNIWVYNVPNDTKSLVFNNGSGDQTADYNGSPEQYANKVFIYIPKGSDASGACVGDISTYTQSGTTDPEPDPEPDPTGAVFVYLDANNANPAWSDVRVYAYNENVDPKIENSSWPGVSMTKDESTGYWYYMLPDNLKSSSRVIFSCNGKDPRYPADKKPGLEISGKSMIFHVDGNKWEEYDGSVPEPGELVDYTIYFNNNVNWDNVYVSLTGNVPDQSQGGKMYSELNSKQYQFSFQAPENYSLTCNFYYLENDNPKSRTSNFEVVNGHIYTVTGDKGPVDDYVPVDIEAEYWLEPAKPSQNDGATLFYNRAFKSDSNLKNTNEIYAWLGALTTSHTGNNWDVKPSCAWGSITDKYKMTQDSENPDIFSIKLEPSIAEWLEIKDPDTRLNQLAVLFRDKSGDNKTDDYFIDLLRLPEPGVGLGAYKSHELKNNELTVSAENGKLFITPLSSEVIKVFTLKNNLKATERPSISVLAPGSEGYTLAKPEEFSATLNDKEGYLSVTVDGTERLRIDKTTMLITFLDDEGNITLKELNGLLNNPGNIQVSFEGMNDDGFYGGGYNGKHVNWEGKGSIVMNNSQTGGWAQDIQGPPHNICIPYFVSTKGYGLYFDDHYRNAQLKPSANGTLYNSGSSNPIAYYYIGGGSMEKAMQNYTRLTGLAELPPFWAMGYITSKFSFKSRTEAEEVITKTKENKIPLDGIVFDIHWQGGPSGMGKINWDTSKYNDPAGMMSSFSNQNIHTIAITEPYFTKASGNYDYLNNNGYFADSDVSGMEWLGSKSGLLDITNTDALKWFKDLYKQRTREGIESWWLDLGEPEKHDYDSHYKDGSSVDQIHNEYGQRWLAASFEAMKELDAELDQPARRITMPRSGTAGMQRYNAFPWTGDIRRSWGGLKAQVPAMVSAAMSGVSYLGSDIGGFGNPTGFSDRLYLRWVQLGVFYPSMRTHADAHNYPYCLPEPYHYGNVINEVRDAINLRYAYLPYTYSQSYAYSRYGTPIARPANFSNTDKSYLSNCIDAYYWGPDLFVAPMLSDGTSRSIEFPEGDWLDMNNVGNVYSGSNSYSYQANLSTLPYFMRRGSFLTRYAQDTFTSTAEIKADRFIVHYFPNYTDKADGSTFFDDDHKDVNSIRNGNYVATHFSGTGSLNEAQPYVGIWLYREGNGWKNMYESQDITFQIHDMFDVSNPQVHLFTYGKGLKQADAPARAPQTDPNCTKVAINAVSSADALAGATDNGYYIDRNTRTMHVRLPKLNPLTTYALTVARDDIFTGIEAPSDLASMSLSYGSGYLTYVAPEGTENLSIEIYSATGANMAGYDCLEADGYANQIAVQLPQGIYIARLSGNNSAGETQTRTVKMIVR